MPRGFTIATMEQLRSEGWCVVLKCMPPDQGWIIKRSRSEYDAPCPDRTIGHGKWAAVAQDMAWRMNQEVSAYRGEPFALGDTAEEAMNKLWEIVHK